MSRRKVYGWNSTRLYQAYSISELTEIQAEVMADPANANPDHARGSIWLYTPAARRKLDALAFAITEHLKDKARAAA